MEYAGGMRARDLIRRIGGAVIARRLGITPQSVSVWAVTGAIPRKRIAEVRQIAREHGIELSEEDILGVLGIDLDGKGIRPEWMEIDDRLD